MQNLAVGKTKIECLAKENIYQCVANLLDEKNYSISLSKWLGWQVTHTFYSFCSSYSSCHFGSGILQYRLTFFPERNEFCLEKIPKLSGNVNYGVLMYLQKWFHRKLCRASLVYFQIPACTVSLPCKARDMHSIVSRTHLSVGSMRETSVTCRGASLGKKPPA